MSSQSVEEETPANWPTFTLRYTFNPVELDTPAEFAPDELVVTDPGSDDDGAWLSASRGAYVDIQDAR